MMQSTSHMPHILCAQGAQLQRKRAGAVNLWYSAALVSNKYAHAPHYVLASLLRSARCHASRITAPVSAGLQRIQTNLCLPNFNQAKFQAKDRSPTRQEDGHLLYWLKHPIGAHQSDKLAPQLETQHTHPSHCKCLYA